MLFGRIRSTYIQGDNLEVCGDFDSERWEDNFIDSLTGQEESNATAEEMSDSEEVDILLQSLERHIVRRHTDFSREPRLLPFRTC